MAHVHAELMAQYADDAKNFDEPWKLWEYRSSDGEWVGFSIGRHPAWSPVVEYRRRLRRQEERYWVYMCKNGSLLISTRRECRENYLKDGWKLILEAVKPPLSDFENL